MESVKQKRFSFAGFSSSLSRSLSFSSGEQKLQEDSNKSKRSQKTKSLYIKSFRKPTEEKTIATSYDEKEAAQSNGKEIRNSIRRSLSAVIYATPQVKGKQGENDNKLVPVLVTPGLSESVGGILIDDSNNLRRQKEQEAEKKPDKKKKAVEYDNTLDIFPDSSECDSITVLWQGYCYTVKTDEKDPVASEILANKEKEVNSLVEDLVKRFDKEIWNSYHGLIHPVHLFQDKDNKEQVIEAGKWNGLSVEELKRYYDNYGSMMLKIRESRMIEQQRYYQCLPDAKKEWIIPEIIKEPQQITEKA